MKKFIVLVTITLLICGCSIVKRQSAVINSRNIAIKSNKNRKIVKASDNEKARYKEIKKEEDAENRHNETLLAYAHQIENLDMNTLNQRSHSSWSNNDMGLVGYMMYQMGYRRFSTSSFIKDGQIIFYSQANIGDIFCYGSQENPQYLAIKMDGDNVLMLVSGKIKIVKNNVVPNEVIKLN
ncbi:MAG: hypothetical protein ABF991_00370 [Liquorilactobacillus hordei]|uniref:hypothetical protein n=1 Tax=Liquorilactobacillus hordei TaxID=468911 RepID=UPI0039EB078E